ncbi:LAMI_0C04874g1_1 [Lachancea mirantina]|uniref:LAMI_0C04874g1_1 n=1 Tax=Lachancea mirantina TaxID=1230905 RepID=A0A1G4J2Y8_9SACH|nr:LAMI_0C04874g1_1 [Lachancea mirantina]
MIRRHPTAITLGHKDILELKEELEEQRLQREIKEQQKRWQMSEQEAQNASQTDRDQNFGEFDDEDKNTSHISIKGESATQPGPQYQSPNGAMGDRDTLNTHRNPFLAE